MLTEYFNNKYVSAVKNCLSDGESIQPNLYMQKIVKVFLT